LNSQQKKGPATNCSNDPFCTSFSPKLTHDTSNYAY